MGYLSATLEALWSSLGQMVEPPSTVQYPKIKRPRAPRIRASFALLMEENGDEACIGCKKCEKICPSDVITVVAGKKPSPITGKARGYADDFVLNLQACIICELCVQVCPVDAIVMVKDQETPAYSREDLTLTMDRLYKNGKTKERLSWSTGTLLAEQQKPEEKKPVVAAAAPVPAAVVPATEPKPA